MTLSRREFVRLGSLSALSAGLTLGIIESAFGQKGSGNNQSGFAIPYESQLDPLFHMGKATFTQHLNTRFVIDPGYTFPVETILIEVKDLRSAAARKRNVSGQDCFLLTFRAHNENLVKQGTYQVKHDALGTFELFVVPFKNNDGVLFFEAVINRLIG